MPVNVAFDSTTGIHTLTTEGDPSVEAITEAVTSVYASATPDRPFRMLWDLHGVVDSMSTAELVRLVGWVRENRPAAGGRTAVVARADVQFGVSRQAQAFAEGWGDDMGVFRSYGDAVAWLTEVR